MGASKKNKATNPVGFFFGLNTIDLQFQTGTYPSANTKTRAAATALHVGGPATNAAICFQWLGGIATLCTPVGFHSFSNFISGELKKLKVSLIDAAAGKNNDPTIASIVSELENGTRTIVVSPPPPIRKTEKSFPDAELKDNPRVLLLDGFYMEQAIMLAKKYQSLKVPVILDGGSWKKDMDKLLPHVDIAICSASFRPPDVKTKDEIFEYLAAKEISKAAITHDANPVLLMEDKQKSEVATIAVDTVDSLAAGDFFHGAFCYYYALNYSFTESIKGATIIAGNSCKYFGTREWMKKINPQHYQQIQA